MENEDRMDLRSQAVEAAREAESMTEGFRIVRAFNTRQRCMDPAKAAPEIHFQEVWSYLTEARWKGLEELASREFWFQSRAALIERCRSLPLLDAAFEWVCNRFTFGRSSSDEFYIDQEELFHGVPPDQLEDAIARSERLRGGAGELAMAMLNYPQATRTYEEELEHFRRNNPGFSEETYALAQSRGMVGM